MKIGIDCFGLKRQHYTGKEVYVQGLINGLLRREDGLKFTAIYPEKPTVPLHWDSKSIIEITRKSISSYTIWNQLSLPFAVKLLKPDVMVYTESMLPLLNLSPVTRKVVIVYDVMFRRVKKEFDVKTRYVLDTLMPHTLRKADTIITISEASKKDLVKIYNVNPQKIHVVYPCVSDKICPLSQAVKLQIKTKYGLTGRIVTYAGNHLIYKNVENLILAFTHLIQNERDQDVSLVLVGKRERRTAVLEKLIHTAGLEKKVLITGYVDRMDYKAIIGSSDVLVLPSLYEGFGIPLIEAMASGVPVAASNVGATAEVVGSAGVLFNPRDPNDIARGIHSIVYDPRRTEELVVKGLERVKLFQWKRSAEILAQVLKAFDNQH